MKVIKFIWAAIGFLVAGQYFYWATCKVVCSQPPEIPTGWIVLALLSAGAVSAQTSVKQMQKLFGVPTP